MRYLTAACWAVFVALLCAFPGQHIPQFQLLNHFSADKLLHGLLFFMLVMLLLRAAREHPDQFRKLRFYFLTDACFYGLLLEFCQTHFFVNRFGEWVDIVANSSGAVLAFLWAGKETAG